MAVQTTIKERVSTLETTIPEIKKTLINIKTNAEEVRRAIYGFDGTPGVLHKVSTLEEKMGDIKKLMWAILVVVLGIAAGGLYEAITHAASAIK